MLDRKQTLPNRCFIKDSGGRRRLLALATTTALLVISGCELLGSSSTTNSPDTRGVIQFAARGGWGPVYDLSVSAEGMVTDSLRHPDQQLQLTEDEHDELMELFQGFADLDSLYFSGQCFDAPVYSITYSRDTQSKTVTADACALDADAAGDVAVLYRIVEALSRLGDRVYEASAP